MQSPNHRSEKLDTLSQHAFETNHRLGKSDTLSKQTQHRQAIPACTAKYVLYKRLQKPKTGDKLTQQNSCRTRRDLHKKSKQLQHLRRIVKRHRTASAGLGLEDQYIGYKLGPIPCCYCSTTEGELELRTKQSTSLHSCHNPQSAPLQGLPILYLYKTVLC